jgi:hypothetical protein
MDLYLKPFCKTRYAIKLLKNHIQLCPKEALGICSKRTPVNINAKPTKIIFPFCEKLFEINFSAGTRNKLRKAKEL